MAQRPLFFSNLKDDTTPQFFASYVEVVLQPENKNGHLILVTEEDIWSIWDESYGCLREGYFLPARHDEPWRLTLRVQYLNRRDGISNRKWVSRDIVTPYLLELLDTTGLGILSPQALAMLPADMRAYLERDREQDAPSWFTEIQTALNVPE